MTKAKKKLISKKRSKVKSSKKKVVKKRLAKRKSKKVSAVPKGYTNIIPYLIISGAANAITFYKKAFGAKEKFRMERQAGVISHAELQFGDTKIMLADECPEMEAFSPQKIGGSPVIIHYYTKNVDKVFERAIASGAKLVRPIQNMFYGDRSGVIEDPYGYKWNISTHIENVTPAETKKRARELFNRK